MKFGRWEYDKCFCSRTLWQNEVSYEDQTCDSFRSLGGISPRKPSLSNFPSEKKASSWEIFSISLTVCDHFVIITTAEILRAATYQCDWMAARQKDMSAGGNTTETNSQETQEDRQMTIENTQKEKEKRKYKINVVRNMIATGLCFLLTNIQMHLCERSTIVDPFLSFFSLSVFALFLSCPFPHFLFLSIQGENINMCISPLSSHV